MHFLLRNRTSRVPLENAEAAIDCYILKAKMLPTIIDFRVEDSHTVEKVKMAGYILPVFGFPSPYAFIR